MRVAAILAFALTLAAASPARAELTVTMHDGLVSVNASGVTVRQILAEWARVGQTQIVNAEGVTGGTLTLQLTDVPEEQALDILLRGASGYMAARRAVREANASFFDRIIVMPTSAPSRTAPSAPLAPPRGAAVFQNDQNDDDQQRPGAPPPAPPLSQQRGFAPIPAQDGPVVAAPPPVPTAAPSGAAGVSVPGMVVPAPPGTQPGQPSGAPAQR